MAKIARFSGNVQAFASNQQSGERRVFGATTPTESDLLSDQLTPEFLRGWGTVGASEFPPIEWFNALGFTVTQFIAYLHQAGIPEWDENQEYNEGSIANYSGVIYVSTSDGNVGNNPYSSALWDDPVRLSEERSLGSDASLFKGANGAIANGETIPVGTTHVTVEIGGKERNVAIFPILDGTISNLNTSTAPYSVDVGGTNCYLLDTSYFNLPTTGVSLGAFWADPTGSADSLPSAQALFDSFNNCDIPDGNFRFSDSAILSKDVYNISGGAKSRLWFDQADFPENSSLLKSLESDRPSGNTLGLSIQGLDFYAYNPELAAPSTVKANASAIFASGVTSANGKACIDLCRFRGFDVHIRGSAWWGTSIKRSFFRTYTGEGLAIDFRPGQYTGDTGWSGAFAINSVTVSDCWFNTLNDVIKTGDQNVQKLRVSENTFERIDNVVLDMLGSYNTDLTRNHFEYVNIPFRIGFTGTITAPVQNFNYTQNNLDVITGVSFINNAENSVFRYNNRKNTSVNDFTFFNGSAGDYNNNIIEYVNGLAFGSNISKESNRIYSQSNANNTSEGIIESGSNSNGDYIKFADGTMICNHVISGTDSVTEAYGSLFRSSSFSTWTYPQLFTENPVATANIETNVPTFALLQASNNASATYRVAHYESDASLSVVIKLQAIGKWK